MSGLGTWLSRSLRRRFGHVLAGFGRRSQSLGRLAQHRTDQHRLVALRLARAALASLARCIALDQDFRQLLRILTQLRRLSRNFTLPHRLDRVGIHGRRRGRVLAALGRFAGRLGSRLVATRQRFLCQTKRIQRLAVVQRPVSGDARGHPLGVVARLAERNCLDKQVHRPVAALLAPPPHRAAAGIVARRHLLLALEAIKKTFQVLRPQADVHRRLPQCRFVGVETQPPRHLFGGRQDELQQANRVGRRLDLGIKARLTAANRIQNRGMQIELRRRGLHQLGVRARKRHLPRQAIARTGISGGVSPQHVATDRMATNPATCFSIQCRPCPNLARIAGLPLQVRRGIAAQPSGVELFARLVVPAQLTKQSRTLHPCIRQHRVGHLRPRLKVALDQHIGRRQLRARLQLRHRHRRIVA